MRKPRYFLDANILVSGLAVAGNERRLLTLGASGKVDLVTSEYVLKEVGDALVDLGLSSFSAFESIVWLRNFMSIEGPSDSEVKEYWSSLRDKSDVPVLASAVKFRCILVTGDKELRRMAKKFVDVKTTTEILKEIL